MKDLIKKNTYRAYLVPLTRLRSRPSCSRSPRVIGCLIVVVAAVVADVAVVVEVAVVVVAAVVIACSCC